MFMPWLEENPKISRSFYVSEDSLSSHPMLHTGVANESRKKVRDAGRQSGLVHPLSHSSTPVSILYG